MPHPTKSNLSTIKGIWITERLNEVFGPGAWKNKSDLIGNIAREVRVIPAKQNKAAYERIEYTAVIKTIFEVPEYGIYYECIAGSTNDDAGDAAKGGITDCITKICSWMGIGADVYKGLHKHESPKETKTEQPPLDLRPPLSPDNKKEWAHQILCLQNEKYGIDVIVRSYNVSQEHRAELLQAAKKPKPILKPGSDQWNKSVEWLSKDGNKIETITWKYSISDQDLIDLQEDAINFTPATTNEAK